MRAKLIRFAPGDFFFHRLTPLPKLIWAGAITVCAVSVSGASAMVALFAIVLWTVWVLCRIRLRDASSVVVLFFVLGLTLFLVQAVTTPGVTLLISAGPIRVTAEGVDLAGAVSLRMACLVLVAIAFVSTTDPAHFGSALRDQLRLPSQFALALFMALRMAEVFEREAEALANTYRLRFSRRPGFVASLRHSGLFAVGLLARGLRRGQALSLSMTIRGLEEGTAIGPRIYGTVSDRTFALATVALAALFIVASHALAMPLAPEVTR